MPEVGAPTPTVVHVAADRRHLINPGSIGQPPDDAPRAAYAMYDVSKGDVELRRVPYRVDLA